MNVAYTHKEIGKRLKLARKSRNLSEKDLAGLVDVAPAYVCMIESGKRVPSLKRLMSLLEKLNVKPIDFFREELTQ